MKTSPSTFVSRLQVALVKKLARKACRMLPEIALRTSAACLALFALFGFNPQALAATDTWTGATDSTWAGNNWAPSGPPGSGDNAVFNSAGNGNTTIDLGAGVSINNISYFTASAAAYTIGAGGVNNQTLTLANNNSGFTVGPLVIHNQLVNASVLLANGAADNFVILNSGTNSTLTLAGTVQGGTGGTAGAQNLYVEGPGNTTITGNISNGGATTVGLVKQGTGILDLGPSAAEGYTGATAVQEGTLELDYSSGANTGNILGSTAVSLSGATLNVNGNSTTATTQTLSGITFSAGANVVTTSSNGATATIALGAITATKGANVVFNGPATIGANNVAVAAAGVITTTSSGAGIATGTPSYGLLASGGNNSDYATVGLYDWASTDLANDTAATPYTIIGGSQVTSFYTASVNNASATTASNLDLTTQQTPSFGGTSDVRISGNTTVDSIRFNSGHAPYITVKSGDVLADGGVLITPNMGTINAGIDAIRLNAAVGLQIVQNNTSGVFCLGLNGNQVINTGNAGDYVVFSGAGTTFLNPIAGTHIAFNYLNASNAVTQSTSTYYDSTLVGSAALGTQYLNGGTVAINSGAAFSNPTTMATTAGGVGTLNMDGGTVIGVVDTFALNDAGGAARNIFLGSDGGGFAAEGGASAATVGEVPTTLTVGGVITGAAGTGPLVIGIPAEAANGNVLGLVPGTGPNTANPGYYALGTVILNNTANTYTGGTVLDSGTLQLTSANLNVLGTGGVTLNGGSFQWGSSNTTDLSARTITLASGGLFDTNGNNVTFANSIGNSGTGGFTKFGSGTLTMNGANTFTGPVTLSNGNLTFGSSNIYTGATTVSAGTLTLASGASLANTPITVQNNATMAVTGNSIGTNGASLTLAGGSTYTQQNSAIDVVTLNSTVANNATPIFTLGDGTGAASVKFDLNSTSSDELVINDGATAFGADGAKIYVDDLDTNTPLSSYTLISDPSGGISVGSSLGAYFQLGNASLPVNGTTYVLSLANSTSTSLILSLTAAPPNYYWTGNTNTSWATFANFATDHTGATPQTFALAAYSNVFETADSPTPGTYTQTLDGSYTINSLVFTGGATGAASNSVVINNGSGTNILTISGASQFTDSQTSTSYGPGIGIEVEAGTAAHTINANVALGNSQTWEVDNAASAPLTVTGNITDGSTNDSLTKTGAGLLILSGANTYNGGTFVSGGTLQLGAANTLLTTAPVTVENTGTFDLAGNNQTVSGLSDGSTSTGVITASTGASTFTINNSTASSYSGTITGGISLVMGGASALTLGGSNSYTGSTTVNNGTLVAANNYALGSPTTGGLILPGAGTSTVDFTSANPTIGSLSGGTGASLIDLGNISGAGSATSLTIGGAGATTVYGGNISDGTTGAGAKATAIGSLTLTGGQLTLNGTGTFTGTTTLTGGTLVIGNFLAIENSTLNYNNQGGTLSFGTATAATFGGLNGAENLALTNSTPAAVALTIGNNNESSITTGNLGGLGSLFKVGSGTFQAGSGTTGGATYAGPTLVNQGTLILGGTTTLSSNIDVGAVGGTSALTIQDDAVINSPGVLEIASDDSTANGTEQNGNPGVSTLLITGTAQVTATGLSIGNVTGATPSRVPTGDSITISGLANVTINGIDTLDNTEGSTASAVTENLNGGTLGVNSIALGFANGTSQTATIHLNGGTLEALGSDPSGTVFFLPATTGITVDVDSGGAFINTNGHTDTIAAVLAHGTGTPDGGLTKQGAGSLILTGAANYTGPTTVSAGTLVVKGGLSASSGVTVANGATFEADSAIDSGDVVNDTAGGSVDGTGSIGGANVTGGTLAPGLSTGSTTPGTLTSSGNVALATGATFAVRLGLSTGVSTDVDSLTLTGAAAFTLDGTETLQINDTTAEYGATLGTLYIIVNGAGSSVGADATGAPGDVFSNAPTSGSFVTTSNNDTFAVLYATDAAGDGQGTGNDIALELVAVPEPGTWASLLGGIGMLVVWQRTRRRRS